MKTWARALSFLLVLSGTPALAKDPGAPSTYAIGRDMARLEREVEHLRALMEQMLELDRQRVALLEEALAGKRVSKAERRDSRRATPRRSVKPRQTKAKRRYGSITGMVKKPAGDPTAWVYIENLKSPLVDGHVDIAQKGRRFVPGHVVVQRGTTVRFPNLDTTYHNVFAANPAATFDLGIYRSGDSPRSYRFVQAGDIEIYCNMHANMMARVLILPGEHAAQVDASGRYTLKKVPPGTHTLVAWSPKGRSVKKEIEVRAGQELRVAMRLEKASRKRHKNKLGQPYGSYD